MSLQRASLQAVDRQALYVVQSIRDVIATLEKRRERYRSSHDDGQRALLRSGLLNDIDRLSNLVALLQSLPSDQLQPATCRALQNCLDHMRDKISRMGAVLTLDKIRELRSVAEYSARRHEHPIGKSYLLRESFIRYLSYLQSLALGLSKENADDLRSSALSINSLIEKDRRKLKIPSFANDPDILLIDLKSLPVNDGTEESSSSL